MCGELTDSVVATIKDAAEKLTGHRKRAFQAKVTPDYLGGSARRTETAFGWGREAVRLPYKSAHTEITEIVGQLGTFRTILRPHGLLR